MTAVLARRLPATAETERAMIMNHAQNAQKIAVHATPRHQMEKAAEEVEKAMAKEVVTATSLPR
jgi:hypothetical protein